MDKARYQVTLSVVKVGSSEDAGPLTLPAVGNTPAELFAALGKAAGRGANLSFSVKDDTTERFKTKEGKARGSVGWYVFGKVELPQADDDTKAQV